MIRRIKPLELLLAIVLLGVAAACLRTARLENPFGTYSPLADDAYISLRFAHHVAQGYGFVWNPGEASVSGFTSLLHVLMLAAIEKAGLTPLAHVPLLGAAFGVVTMALALLLFERVNPTHRAENLTGAILFGLAPSLWYWSTAGLETTLFAALLTGCFLFYIHPGRTAIQLVLLGALFGFTALTCPRGRVCCLPQPFSSKQLACGARGKAS